MTFFTHRGVYPTCLTVLFTLLLFLNFSTSAQKPGQKTCVIVHGAFGGGWAFSKVDSLLTLQGYKVYRPTLTGLGERSHLASADIGLETHIQDVVNVILFENLKDIILIGHSYGGMVVTGVADKLPGRIKKLIYLDALLPEDGESVKSMLGTPGTDWLNDKEKFLIPAWVKPGQQPPMDVPHPVKTFTDTIRLSSTEIYSIPVTYILTIDPGKRPEDDGFFKFFERARERGVRVLQMSADHNPNWTKPLELSDLLLVEFDK